MVMIIDTDTDSKFNILLPGSKINDQTCTANIWKIL